MQWNGNNNTTWIQSNPDATSERKVRPGQHGGR